MKKQRYIATILMLTSTLAFASNNYNITLIDVTGNNLERYFLDIAAPIQCKTMDGLFKDEKVSISCVDYVPKDTDQIRINFQWQTDRGVQYAHIDTHVLKDFKPNLENRCYVYNSGSSLRCEVINEQKDKKGKK